LGGSEILFSRLPKNLRILIARPVRRKQGRPFQGQNFVEIG
jgi:hypothetical protein